MAGGSSEQEIKLEYTPTWIVALVCTVIVFISLVFERLLHHLGKVLKRKHQMPLFDALQKLKEELMLLGFISLLLVVFQGSIQRICIPESVTHHLRPCNKNAAATADAATVGHYSVGFSGGILGGARRLLAGGGGDSLHCINKGKVPLLSLEAIHQLHIFIFILAVTHVVLSLITVVLGIAQMRKWRAWEESIKKEERNDPSKISYVHQFEFIQNRFKGFGKDSFILTWLSSFFKQFYRTITETDYTTMRLGFIMKHCKGNPNFNFYKYMIRVLEADFKKVVGISWYLWVFVMIFLLLNVEAWHVYFWMSFVPLILLLAVGTKLEHIIIELAHEVAHKNSVIAGNLVVTPSDQLFWFKKPRIVIFLIHFILFQNAFEIAFFFWILTTYGFDSCIMGQVGYIVPRLVISVIIQFICSYSTLPLYAIVTQMGDTFNKAIFDENIQLGLLGWAQGAKNKKNRVVNGVSQSEAAEETNGRSAGVQLQNAILNGRGGRNGEINEVKEWGDQ